MEIPYCEFCKLNYGGSYSLQPTSFGTLLIIKNGTDTFYINLTDKMRFGKYSLVHKGNRIIDGTYQKHTQFKTFYLNCAIYAAFTHEFNKSIGIYSTGEDRMRFDQDYLRQLEYNERIDKDD